MCEKVCNHLVVASVGIRKQAGKRLTSCIMHRDDCTLCRSEDGFQTEATVSLCSARRISLPSCMPATLGLFLVRRYGEKLFWMCSEVIHARLIPEALRSLLAIAQLKFPAE